MIFVILVEGSLTSHHWRDWVCELQCQFVVRSTSPVALTPLFILTLLMLCDWRGAGICFCREGALRHEHACVCALLSVQVRTSVRRLEAEAASCCRPGSPLILTHFHFPARRFLFNCRAAHWGHLLDWGLSPWRCWEAFRICCGVTNREIEVREWG